MYFVHENTRIIIISYKYAPNIFLYTYKYIQIFFMCIVSVKPNTDILVKRCVLRHLLNHYMVSLEEERNQSHLQIFKRIFHNFSFQKS